MIVWNWWPIAMDFVLVMGLGGLVLFYQELYLISWTWWVFCAVYVVMVRNWGWEPLLRINYACFIGTMLSNWIGMIWTMFGSRVQCLCVWNSARVCNSRSSEPGSPRRDMQGLTPFSRSRLSLRRKVLVWAEGHLA